MLINDYMSVFNIFIVHLEELRSIWGRDRSKWLGHAVYTGFCVSVGLIEHYREDGCDLSWNLACSHNKNDSTGQKFWPAKQLMVTFMPSSGHYYYDPGKWCCSGDLCRRSQVYFSLWEAMYYTSVLHCDSSRLGCPNDDLCLAPTKWFSCLNLTRPNLNQVVLVPKSDQTSTTALSQHKNIIIL